LIIKKVVFFLVLSQSSYLFSIKYYFPYQESVNGIPYRLNEKNEVEIDENFIDDSFFVSAKNMPLAFEIFQRRINKAEYASAANILNSIYNVLCESEKTQVRISCQKYKQKAADKEKIIKEENYTMWQKIKDEARYALNYKDNQYYFEEKIFGFFLVSKIKFQIQPKKTRSNMKSKVFYYHYKTEKSAAKIHLEVFEKKENINNKEYINIWINRASLDKKLSWNKEKIKNNKKNYNIEVLTSQTDKIKYLIGVNNNRGIAMIFTGEIGDFFFNYE